MKTYAFIDASNLFYGGEKSLGWKIDYQKLLAYLEEKYLVSHTIYFGGVEIHDFPYDYQRHDSVPLSSVEQHIRDIITSHRVQLNEAQLMLMDRHLKRIHFYQRLKLFGYQLMLKPVKSYEQDDGTIKRKANCDVDMAFHLMKLADEFQRVIILSGDGDFLPVLKHFKSIGKNVIVLARGNRTAKEIRQFAGSAFCDFEYLRERVKLKQ